MSGQIISAEQRMEQQGFKWLTTASVMFFLVYVGIHIGLNYFSPYTFNAEPPPAISTEQVGGPDMPALAQPGDTTGVSEATKIDQEERDGQKKQQLKEQPPKKQQPTGWQRFVLEISGPITISICSSLLIFSFGTFLLHGLKHLSVSAPGAFLGAFLIFIYGQVVVQVCGHAEIYVYNQSVAGQTIHWSFLLFSAAAYPAAFFSLFYLEHYAARVFKALRPQLPKEEQAHEITARSMTSLTLISVFLLCIKPWVLGMDDNASKFGVTVVSLCIEFAIAFVVYIRARSHNHARKSYVTKDEQ